MRFRLLVILLTAFTFLDDLRAQVVVLPPLQQNIIAIEGSPEGRLAFDVGIVVVDVVTGKLYSKRTTRASNTGWQELAVGAGSAGLTYSFSPQFTTTGVTNVAIASGALLTNATLVTAASIAIGTTNVVGALSTKAALNSPSFTGSPMATSFSISGELDVALIVATNGIAFTDTLVANLGTPTASTFPIKYSSDVVTSPGVGGYVRWDGSAWKTWENVVPTSSILDFILKARTAGLNTVTPISNIQFISDQFNAANSFPGRTYTAVGTSATAAGSAANVKGSYIQYATGSTAAGAAHSYGRFSPVLASGDYYAVSGQYSVSALCDATDKYFAIASGMTSLNSTNVPVSGCFFLYDMFGVTGIGITNSSASNNWIAVSCKAGVCSTNNTGLPVTTTTTAPSTLEVIATTTAVYFYTNKVLAVTVSDAATIPTVSMYINRTQMMKDTGGTSRGLNEWTPANNTRHASRAW